MAQTELIDALEHVLKKIKEAAQDGQNGSANYAMDRLRLIEQYDDIGLKKRSQ